MKKKIIRCLSTLALSAMVGVSALATMAYAEEYSECSLNGGCPWCGYADYEEIGREIVDISYANPSNHLIEADVDYRCNVCGFEQTETEYYEEGHNYELVEATGQMICEECYDSYYISRALLTE